MVVYVCNLNPSVAEFDLRKAFGGCGEVDQLLVSRDKFGVSKCWALVKFTEPVSFCPCCVPV